jgi:23S rRNA (cytidine1920-2'-O)/16S rRNA (cytidine1409-2'-O)-methyltransferase
MAHHRRAMRDESSTPSETPEPSWASRGALKLEHALDEFGISVEGKTCADFGCSTGGFVDVLLRRGAARVFAVDTAYGQLAYRLRVDKRVVVMERTNALYAAFPEEHKGAKIDVISIDLGWTPQDKAIPAALRWLREHDPDARIVSLVKPQYELTTQEKATLLRDGVLDEADAERITERVVRDLPALGVRVVGLTKSPILGGETRGKRRGNAEWLVALALS